MKGYGGFCNHVKCELIKTSLQSGVNCGTTRDHIL